MLDRLLGKYAVPACLSGLVLGAGLFSAFLLIPQSLRLDEAQSLWQTSHGTLGIFKIVGQDVHVPLYHLMLHYWQLFLGNSVAAARTLSIIFFLATIPMAYALGRLAFPRNTALFVAAITAASPFLAWYGSEIRMYSLLMFLVVVNQYAYLRLVGRDGTGMRWLWFVSAAFGMYSHYLFAAHLAAQAAFTFAKRSEIGAGLCRRLTLGYAGIVLLFVPWVAYVVYLGSASTTRPSLAIPTAIDLFNSLAQFGFGFQEQTVSTAIVSLWPLAVLLVFFALQRDQRMPFAVQYFAASFLLPIAAVFGFSLFVAPFFLSRYLIFVVPSCYLVMGWLFSTYGAPGRWFRYATVALMLVALAAQGVDARTPVREDYSQVAAYLKERTDATDVVIVSAPFTVYPLQYYYEGPATLRTLPDWDRRSIGGIPAFDASTLPKQVDEETAYKRKACLVLSYDQGYQEVVFQYFEHHFQGVSEREFSPGLSVECYTVGRYGKD